MSKKYDLVNLNTELPYVIISLVKSRFVNLGEDIADVLLLAEVNVQRNFKDKETIYATLNINNQIANNIDRILLQYCNSLIIGLEREVFRIN